VGAGDRLVRGEPHQTGVAVPLTAVIKYLVSRRKVMSKSVIPRALEWLG
jgi:hypothetical protein